MFEVSVLPVIKLTNISLTVWFKQQLGAQFEIIYTIIEVLIILSSWLKLLCLRDYIHHHQVKNEVEVRNISSHSVGNRYSLLERYLILDMHKTRDVTCRPSNIYFGSFKTPAWTNTRFYGIGGPRTVSPESCLNKTEEKLSPEVMSSSMRSEAFQTSEMKLFVQVLFILIFLKTFPFISFTWLI